MAERERDDTSPEDVPATNPTDEDDETNDKDAAVDETSEESMDGSDAPAW